MNLRDARVVRVVGVAMILWVVSNVKYLRPEHPSVPGAGEGTDGIPQGTLDAPYRLLGALHK
jgi:hypothetical protein